MRVVVSTHRPGLRAAGRGRRSTRSALAGATAPALAVPAGGRRTAGRRPAPPGGGCCSAVLVVLGLLGWVVARCCGAGAGAGGCRRVEPDGEDVPLRFEGVTKAYKDGFVAVRDLSFEVRRGQVLGLLGPERRRQDDVPADADGPDPADRGADPRLRARRRARARPCSPGSARSSRAPASSRTCPAGTTCACTGRRPAGRPRTRTWPRRSRSPASGTALDRPVRRYSQGMRQRLAIAQAMLGLPDLLVLDEPTNGLDPPQIHAMREVLRSYAATGRTVIVSSHLLSEIEQTCSHVVVMAKGQKIAQGTVEEIVGTGGAVLGRAGRRRRDRPGDRRPGGAARRDRRAHRRGAGRRPRRHRPGARRCRRWSPPASRSTSSRRAAGWRTRSWRWWGSHDDRIGRSWPSAPRAPSTCSRRARSPGTGPERTLRLSVELRRQFKRRRTIGVFALMVALPLMLIAALQLGASEEAQRTAGSTWSTSPPSSGLNFTLFVLFATTGFFLVVVFALFFGDTVASEAQWGSLRYTLATPVPRMRLLRQKWLAALVLSVGRAGHR